MRNHGLRIVYREIEPADNGPLAEIVRLIMTAYGADPETTILGDPSLNTMYENYQESGARYFVVEVNGEIVGGAGIKRLQGSEKNICELQRMFLAPSARGRGIGDELMHLCIQEAKRWNYDAIYLETLGQMTEARNLYRKHGFKEIDKPLGSTGHTGCDVQMLLKL